MNAARKLESGSMFCDRYRIISLMETGERGDLYRAHDATTGQVVALKVMSPASDLQGAGIRRRFFTEASSISRLRHANTLRVLEFGESDGGELYAVSEYLVGETLENALHPSRLRGRTLSEHATCAIVDAVLGGLSEAHELGLVHRNLSPANIFLERMDDGGWAVKLLGFGLVANHSVTIDPNETSLGTPSYMSPEQVQCEPVDGRSDLYAVAVIAFECLTGERPFDGPGPGDTMNNHLQEPVPSLVERLGPTSNERLDAALRLAMAKSPTDRFQTAEEMRHACLLANLAEAPADSLPDSDSGIFDADSPDRTNLGTGLAGVVSTQPLNGVRALDGGRVRSLNGAGSDSNRRPRRVAATEIRRGGAAAWKPADEMELVEDALAGRR